MMPILATFLFFLGLLAIIGSALTVASNALQFAVRALYAFFN
jgi:hypothetical protein